MEESNKKRLPCFCNQILKNSLCRREARVRLKSKEIYLFYMETSLNAKWRILQEKRVNKTLVEDIVPPGKIIPVPNLFR